MKTTAQVFIGVFLALIGFKMFNNMINPPLTPEERALIEFEQTMKDLQQTQKYHLENLKRSSDRIHNRQQEE